MTWLTHEELKAMLPWTKVLALIESVKYKAGYHLNWSIAAFENKNPRFLRIWWQYERPDRDDATGPLSTGVSGERIVDLGKVQTAEQLARHILVVTLAMEEHEAREFLTFGIGNGEGLGTRVRPFDPHTVLMPEEGK